MKKTLIVILSTFLVSFCAKKTPPASVVPIEHYHLENGLQVIIAPRSYTTFTTVLLTYNVGGSFETKEHLGLSHLLEHLMFKSTTNLKNGEFNRILEQDLGGNFNAMTTYDETTYYETFPHHGTKKVLELEAERMQNLALDKDEVDKEKLVVLEEMRNRIENSDIGYFFTKANEFFYQNYPYGRDLGGRANILKVSLNTIKAYYKSYYAPNNATLIITGKVENLNTLKQWVNDYFGKIKSQTIDFTKLPTDFTPPSQKTLVLQRQTPINYALMMTKIPQGTDSKIPALDLLGALLTQGNESYLQKELVLKNQLVSSVYAGPDIQKLKSAFSIYFTPYRKEDISKIQSIIFKALDDLQKDPLLEQKIQTQKLARKTAFYFDIQKPENVAFQISQGIVIAHKPYFMMDRYFKSLSRDDMIKTAEWIKKAPFSEVLMLKNDI